MRFRLVTTATTALVALALAGAPVAAAQPNVAVQESVSVLPWFEVTVDPGPITYGSVAPGGTAVSTPTNSAGHIDSNTRVLIGLQGAAFNSGSHTLPADSRADQALGLTQWPTMKSILNPAVTAGNWYSTSAINALSYLYDAPGPCTSAPTQWCPFSVSLRIAIPADALAGAYTSSIEWTFTSP